MAIVPPDPALIRGHRREVVAVTIAVTAFAILLTFALSRLVEIERDTHTSSGEGIIWALSQTQYEIQRLVLATTPGRAAAPEEISLRLDILLSRLDLLEHGSMASRLSQSGHASVIARAKASALELEPQILSAGDRVELYSTRLARNLGQYLEPLGTIANDLMIENRVAEGERQQAYNNSIVQVIVSILGIMATGGFLVYRLVGGLSRVMSAEAAVRREKTFLDLLMDSSGEGIAAFDVNLACTHWNAGMTHLLGSDASDRLARQLDIADPEFTQARLRRVLAGEEIRLSAEPQSRGVVLEILMFPIRLNGEVTGGIVMVRDVTERHQAQRERQLREVYRDFVSMVSHQFRTPLAVIDSTVHRMVRRGPRMDATELQGRAMTIRTAVAGLARLMDSTLASERIDAGGMELALHPTNLTRLLQELSQRFLDLMPERQIVLELPELAALTCDGPLIDQALGNLVANALKYSPATQPVLVRVRDHPGEIVIAVEDRGVGIPAEELPQIFERFFRASTAQAVAGTGIGLHAARQIVRLHGGEIAVSSASDTGTVFTVTLPKRHQEQTQHEPPAA